MDWGLFAVLFEVEYKENRRRSICVRGAAGISRNGEWCLLGQINANAGGQGSRAQVMGEKH